MIPAEAVEAAARTGISVQINAYITHAGGTWRVAGKPLIHHGGKP